MTQLACLLVVIASCYRPPQPACGFVCGANGACPEDYACAEDNRCHLAGVGSLCESAVDAGPDSPFVPSDVALLDAQTFPLIDILSEFPQPGSVGNPVDTPITVTFSVSLVFVDPTQAHISSVEGLVELTPVAQSPTVALTPDLQLLGGTTYTVSLGSGFPAPNDYSIEPFTWMFTTGPDTIPPNLVHAKPGDGDSASVDTPIVIAFDEHVENLDTTSWVVSSGGTPIAGTVTEMTIDPYEYWTFTPLAPYPAASTIEYTLSSAITDTSGNMLVPIDYTFTTP
jgi:hypothetical protein